MKLVVTFYNEIECRYEHSIIKQVTVLKVCVDTIINKQLIYKVLFLYLFF